MLSKIRCSSTLIKGELISPTNRSAPHATQLHIRRRFQFSSALKRMSTISSLPGGKTLVAVKGAPETIKTMLAVVPDHYDDTYKWFTRKGSRVLALAMKEMEAMSGDKVPTKDRLLFPKTDFCFRSTSYPGSTLRVDLSSQASWYSTAPSKQMRLRHSRCLLTLHIAYVVLECLLFRVPISFPVHHDYRR